MLKNNPVDIWNIEKKKIEEISQNDLTVEKIKIT